QRCLPGDLSNRSADTPGTSLPIAARIGDERASSPVTWSSLTFEQETLVCIRRQSHAQPIIPPDLREKAVQSGEFSRWASLVDSARWSKCCRSLGNRLSFGHQVSCRSSLTG